MNWLNTYMVVQADDFDAMFADGDCDAALRVRH